MHFINVNRFTQFGKVFIKLSRGPYLSAEEEFHQYFVGGAMQNLPDNVPATSMFHGLSKIVFYILSELF